MLKVVRFKNSEEKYSMRTDIEKMFDTIDIKGTRKEKLALHLIDKAEYKNELEVIDRFGDKISIDKISTGCKAALVCLQDHPPMNTCECGLNALSVIFSLCDTGTIYVKDAWCKFPKIVTDNNVNIEMDGIHFKSFDDFNEYWYNS